MTRSNKVGLVQNRRCALPVAMTLALAAAAPMAWGDSGQKSNNIPAADNAAAVDVPVYPFPTLERPVETGLTNNQRGLIKLLGIARKNSTTLAANSQTEQCGQGRNCSPTPGLLPPVNLGYTDNLELPSLVQPNLPELPGLSVEQVVQPVCQLPGTDSAVVMANATLPAQPVQERFSDALSLSGSDLVSSLDVAAPLPPASQSASDPVMTSFSDREDTADASTSSGIEVNLSDKQPQSVDRQPQLVKPRNGMAVKQLPVTGDLPINSHAPAIGTNDSVQLNSASNYSSPQLQELSAGDSVFPAVVPPVSAGAGLSSGDISTRAENKTGQLNLRVEGGPVATKQVAAAVPLLANTKLKQRPVAMTGAPISTQIPAADKRIAIGVKDTVAIQSKAPIHAVSVEHEDICQIVQNGNRTYSVIGLREGETRIALVSNSAEGRQIEIHSVAVGPHRSTTNDASNLATEISQTVRQLYPQSRVRITNQQQQLVVSGMVESEETAKEILNLVRKSTLTPVVDQLTVR